MSKRSLALCGHSCFHPRWTPEIELGGQMQWAQYVHPCYSLWGSSRQGMKGPQFDACHLLPFMEHRWPGNRGILGMSGTNVVNGIVIATCAASTIVVSTKAGTIYFEFILRIIMVIIVSTFHFFQWGCNNSPAVHLGFSNGMMISWVLASRKAKYGQLTLHTLRTLW